MIKKIQSIAAILFSILSLTAASASMAMPSSPEGRPMYDVQNDTGFYVWHDINGDWRMRLVAGSSNQEFIGTIESTRPFDAVKKFFLESDDTVKQTDPARVDFDIQAVAARQDGIDVTIPAGTGICLRGTGTGGVSVYLGPNATPVSTPLDVTGTGACGLKYHPGHYIAMNGYDTQQAMIEAVKPGVAGIQKRYSWGQLEPEQGVYDFSQIESDLTLLADHGMQLVVFIEDKTFKDVKPTPAYLWDSYTLPNRAGGYTAKRWDPYVVERMSALMQKLGERFDANPSFEGIALQESALSINDYTKRTSGYSPEQYRDALITILRNARRSMPTSQVFWYMNFLDDGQAYIADIASAVAPYRVAMGGPDVLPDAWTLIKNSYPYYDQFQGQMTLFGSMQYDSYAHLHKSTSYPTKYWTMPEMFSFARDRLHTSYIFWTRKAKNDPTDSYSWTDALPVIGSNPVINP